MDWQLDRLKEMAFRVPFGRAMKYGAITFIAAGAFVALGTIVVEMLPSEDSPLKCAVQGHDLDTMRKLLKQAPEASDGSDEPEGEEGACDAEGLEAEIEGIITEKEALDKDIKALEQKLWPLHKKREKLDKQLRETKEKLHYKKWNPEIEASDIAIASSRPSFGSRLVIPIIGGWLWNESPLAKAISTHNEEAVAALLDAGADPNVGEVKGLFGSVSRRTPLRIAVDSNEPKIAKMLIEKGANVHNGMTVGPFGIILRSSCMANAVDDKKVDVVRELLAAGADPNSGWCVYFGILAKGGLVQSAAASCPKIFQLLKDNGARLHTPFQVGPFGIISFQSALHSAAEGNQPEVVQTLLEAGGNAQRPGLTIGPLGILGSSYPLSKAAERGGNEIADLLIEAGASPTRGWTCIGGLVASGTPLYRAALQGKTVSREHGVSIPEGNLIETLVKAGAKPTKGDGVGPFGLLAHMSPLFTAAEVGHSVSAAKLLDAEPPADMAIGFSLLGLSVRTPYQWALSKGHKETAKEIASRKQS